MAYLLDSDVFIQSRNTFADFNVFPAFWRWIDKQHAAQKIFSVREVQRELLRQDDDLSKWAKVRKSLFLPTDDAKTYDSLKLLSGWAMSDYAPAAQAKFLGSADFQLVGHAHAHGHIVVTQEKYSAGFEIKIPNACKKMDVDCINIFDLLKKESASFD